jgi:hypothetical protein
VNDDRAETTGPGFFLFKLKPLSDFRYGRVQACKKVGIGIRGSNDQKTSLDRIKIGEGFDPDGGKMITDPKLITSSRGTVRRHPKHSGPSLPKMLNLGLHGRADL